jgi:hypothetical protein
VKIKLLNGVSLTYQYISAQNSLLTRAFMSPAFSYRTPNRAAWRCNRSCFLTNTLFPEKCVFIKQGGVNLTNNSCLLFSFSLFLFAFFFCQVLKNSLAQLCKMNSKTNSILVSSITFLLHTLNRFQFFPSFYFMFPLLSTLQVCNSIIPPPACFHLFCLHGLLALSCINCLNYSSGF